MPDAGTLIVRLFAAPAQHERATIFKPTKNALTAKKARAVQLATPANLIAEARQRGWKRGSKLRGSTRLTGRRGEWLPKII